VSEVDHLDEQLGLHAADELPEGLLLFAGPHVPEGVHEGVDSQADDSLLRSEPAHLTVLSKGAHESNGIILECLETLAYDKILKGLYHSDDNFLASSAGEGESMADKVVVRGVEDNVGARVVGALVHGIRSVQFERGREAPVMHFDTSDDMLVKVVRDHIFYRY